MTFTYQITYENDKARGGYWLAFGKVENRTIIAEGETLSLALLAWLETVCYSKENHESVNH